MLKFIKILLAILILAALLAAPASAQDRGPQATAAPGGYVVFVAGEGSRRSLMMADPAGGIPVTLADLPGGLDTQPAVGPQGQLAWIRRNSGQWELVENGRVVSSGDLHLSPAYQPDGTLVAAVSGRDSTSIYAFRAGSRSLLVDGGSNGLAVSPTFSPDGSKMAYVSNQGDWAQIFVTTPGRENGRRITSGQIRNTDPCWSPTGEWIVFVTAERDICLIRPDGSDLRQLTADQGLNRDPAFSPDGRHIIFSSDRNGRPQLFVMNLDGSDQKLLLPNLTVAQSQPVWSAVRPGVEGLN